ncbi:hypothetical protein BDAP_001676 [Binucleata daphniae]
MGRSYMYENRSKNANRKAREEAQVQLRQTRRDEMIAKKRTTKTDYIPDIPNFITYKTAILSSDPNEIYRGTYSIRKLLSVETNPPIDEVIQSGLLPRITEFLSPYCPIYQNIEKDVIIGIMTEAAWIITNIASGTSIQTSAVVKLGAIKLLIDILSENSKTFVKGEKSTLGNNFSEVIDLTDQCIWALGNIGGDSEYCRDVIINQQGAQTIASFICCLCNPSDKNIKQNENIRVIRNCIWLLSNLCRGTDPAPEYEHLNFCLNFFCQFVLVNDAEIVNDSFWALSHIADCNIQLSEIIIKSVVIERVLLLLKNLIYKLSQPQLSNTIPSFYSDEIFYICNKSISPIIRLIGNCITGADEQTNYLLEFKIYDNEIDMQSLLNTINQKGKYEHKSFILSCYKYIFYKFNDYTKIQRVQKEICWTFSNIAAGTEEHVTLLLEHGIHELLLNALEFSEMRVKVEASWALTNMCVYLDKNYNQYKCLTSKEVIVGLANFLDLTKNLPEIQCNVLSAFEKILCAGEKWCSEIGQENEALNLFNQNVVKIIEDLQDSEEFAVNDKAYNLIVTYFGGVDDN